MKDSVSRRSRGFGFITFADAGSVDEALTHEDHIIDHRRVEAKRAVPRTDPSSRAAEAAAAAAAQQAQQNPFAFLHPMAPHMACGHDCAMHHHHSGSLDEHGRKLGSNGGGGPNGGPGGDGGVGGGGGGLDMGYGPGPGRGATATNKMFVGGLHYETRDGDLRAYFEQFGHVASAEVMFNRETHKSRGFGFVVFGSDEPVGAVLQSTHHTINGKLVEVKPAVPRILNGGIVGVGGGVGCGPGGAGGPGSPYGPGSSNGQPGVLKE
ncbi:unnamed protein product, partial [Phaeothamnion confervicola]